MNKNYILLILIFSLIFVSNKNLPAFDDIVPDPLKFQEMPFDVIHYDLNLDLRKYTTREISGKCTITVKRKVIYDGDYFIFHLRSLQIQKITCNDVAMDYSTYLDENSPYFHYRVKYPDNISDTVKFVIEYSGTMKAEDGGAYTWGGVHYEGTVLYAMGVGFIAPYVSTTQHWMPCFDLPSDKATYKATFIVPKEILAASNGLLKESKVTESGDIEYVWEHDYQISTYLMTFAVGPYILLDFKDYKVPIQIFTLPADSVRSNFAYKEVPAMNDCYSALFGDYPFDKIGFANTTKGAMEHQTMISMPRSTIVNLYAAKNSNNEIAAHELSHMWFGDWVTAKDFRHVWLNESFATYCESLWMNCRDGKKAYLKSQLDKTNNYLNATSIKEGILPLFDFPRALPATNYPYTIYVKGASVLGMLAWELESKGFRYEDIIKKYVNKFSYKNAETADFKEMLETETNLDWQWFFDQWIYGKGWPQIEIIFNDTVNKKYSSDFQIRQIQQGVFYEKVPVEIRYFFSNGTVLDTVHLISGEVTDISLDGKYNHQIDSVKINQANIVAGLYQVKKIGVISSVSENFNNEFEIFQDGNFININYQSEMGGAELSVYDIFGNKVYSEKASEATGMNSFTFSLNNCISGIYFVTIINDGKIFNHKISIIN